MKSQISRLFMLCLEIQCNLVTAMFSYVSISDTPHRFTRENMRANKYSAQSQRATLICW